MELLTLLISSFLFISLLHGFELYRKRKMPPGPAGLPLIGNLLDIGPKPHESLAKLAKKHGPLMTIRLGSVTSVIVTSPDMAREVLQKNDEVCSGRLVPDAVASLKDHSVGFVWIPPHEDWRIIRKALNTYLTHQHKLDTLCDLRYNIVVEMLGFVKTASQKGEAIDIGKLAFATALNKMSNTCFSRNVTDYESRDIGGFGTAVKTIMLVDGKFNIADIFPWLKPFDPQNIRKLSKAAYGWFDQVVDGYISERLKYRESRLPKFGDMLDSLIDYSQENKSEFTLKHIKLLLLDLFLGGTETSSNTTEWAMTELLLNPKIMSKVRQEVSKIVGEDGKIEEAKILQLPYLNAVMKETMRLHLVVPLLIPHKAVTSVNLSGYTVPKNTQILVNAWAIAHDPEYWEDPKVFMPERFLGSEVNYFGKHFSFLPFGSGRRMCPGIPIALRVVSLMLASLVYHFDWKLPCAKEELDMDDIFGITLQRTTPLLAVPLSPTD